MDKFAIDYSSLEEDIAEKPKVFRLADVKDKIKKVAFDVVRFVDEDDLTGLWQVQKRDDGEYIVAQYDDSSLFDSLKEKTAGWSAVSDSTNNIHIFYKDTPVSKLAFASLDVSDDIKTFTSYLPSALASNQTLVEKLLGQLSPEDKERVLASYPELQV